MIASGQTPMPVLSAEQIEQIRADLLRVLSKLERSLLNGQARPADLDQTAVGRLSRIEALQNQGLTQGLHEREQVQLTQVTNALRRIELGSYGLCTACGAPIQAERLLVFPETPSCSRCSGR